VNAQLEFRRIEIMKLRRIVIIPAEDRPIFINKKELANWQKEISKHIEKIQSKWRHGRRIVK
jgi:hypothetical protein